MILSSRSPIVTNAVLGLDCTPISADSTSYNSGTMTANTAAINAWMDEEATHARHSELHVPGGTFIAVNDTLGWDTEAVISGYNGDAAVRILPHGMRVTSGGGWANGCVDCAASIVLRRLCGVLPLRLRRLYMPALPDAEAALRLGPTAV